MHEGRISKSTMAAGPNIKESAEGAAATAIKEYQSQVGSPMYEVI